MVAPIKPAGGDRGPRPQGRRGAVAAGGTEDPKRRRRLAAWLLLGALVVAAALVGIVLAVTSSNHTASSSRQASAGSTGSAQAAGLPPFGLVGGGGITPRSATGKLAVTGSVGDVLFAEDGATMASSAVKVVATAAQEIRQHQASTITVVGHTPPSSITPRPAVRHSLSRLIRPPRAASSTAGSSSSDNSPAPPRSPITPGGN